jgi:hypothetical protein
MLHEDLEINKVSARWIPKFLNAEQKLYQQHICQENFGALADDEEHSSKIITGDRTWVYHWDPPTKQESMQWVHQASRQVREVIDECGFVEMEHPLYSPDVIPSDTYLLPKLNKALEGTAFFFG